MHTFLQGNGAGRKGPALMEWSASQAMPWPGSL
jgi:hypothetical protein